MRFLLFLPLLAAAEPPPLPREIRPEPAQVIPQPDQPGRKVWHTRIFRIDSDLEITPHQLNRLAQVADTTARAVRAHPLPLYAPPQVLRPRIAIYGSEDAYIEAGATRGTAGTYLAPGQTVLIDGNHFFTRHRGGRLPPAADENLLVHELVHLCMHQVQPRVPQWFSEGVAEYFASAHRGAGVFSFANIDQNLLQHLRKRLDPENQKLRLSAISDLADLNSHGWNRHLFDLAPEARYQPYATSLLLVHYHLHGGEARISEVRKALDRRSRRDPPPFPELAATADSIEKALHRYWATKGISLGFPPPQVPSNRSLDSGNR